MPDVTREDLRQMGFRLAGKDEIIDLDEQVRIGLETMNKWKVERPELIELYDQLTEPMMKILKQELGDEDQYVVAKVAVSLVSKLAAVLVGMGADPLMIGYAGTAVMHSVYGVLDEANSLNGQQR